MATKLETGTKKHKLSTAENPCPKKTPPSIDITGPAQVKQNTEAIFRIALKKAFGHQKRLEQTPLLKNDKQLNLTNFRAQGNVFNRSTSRGSDLVFDGIHSEESTGSHANEDEASQEGSLEFALDIDSDSIGGARAETSVDENYETDPARQSQLQDIANRLGEMGDEYQRNNQQEDVDFQQELLTCATSMTSKVVYQTFEKTLDSFLENQQHSTQDPGDQYKVALVLLCTQKAISLASTPVQAASREADRLLGYAVEFVSNHFPHWLGGGA